MDYYENEEYYGDEYDDGGEGEYDYGDEEEEDGSDDSADLASDVAYRDLERIVIGERDIVGTERISKVKTAEQLSEYLREKIGAIASSGAVDISPSDVRRILAGIAALPLPQFKNPDALLAALLVKNGVVPSIDAGIRVLKAEFVRPVDVARYMFLISSL